MMMNLPILSTIWLGVSSSLDLEPLKSIKLYIIYNKGGL